MKNYKELAVWQKAVQLAIEVYEPTSHFPETEKFGLTTQIRKAATSIPANIAEGWGRGTTNDYLRFLSIARGSLMELETHSIVAQGLGFMSQDQLKQTSGSIEEIGRMLNGLMQALKEPKKQAAAAAEAGAPNS